MLIAIGSNDNAAYYLPIAHAKLSKLGSVILSDALINPDFTATVQHPKPDYTNQCAYLLLDAPQSSATLIKQFKQIETDCDRVRPLASTLSTIATNSKDANKRHDNKHHQKVKLVSMDIDILAIKGVGQSAWVMINKRLPLKSHEIIGLSQLVQEVPSVNLKAITPYLSALSVDS